jgi:ubiquinone biosynthesis protein
MSLITSATNATRVVKNVGRMREILSAMTRFGFGTLVERTGLSRFRADSRENAQIARKSIPEKLRLLFEELGPSFIKIGQILAGRPDLIPAELVAEFSKLQDRVSPVPFSILKSVVENELGRSLDQCFASFDTEALASASIAQVHAARTLDGDDVVVKIQKPDVQKFLTQDLEILEMLVAAVEKSIPELRPFKIKTIVKEFKRTLLSELSFTREAQSIRRFRENFAESSFLVIPKVYLDLSAERVITLERLRGVKLSDLEAVRNMGVDPKELLRSGIDSFYQSILINGFFHGDPHGGNILVLPDGRMGLIDFGSVGWLSTKAQSALINMFLALISEDYDSLVQEYMWLSPAANGSRSSNKLEALQADVSTIMAPYHGVPIKDIPAGKVLMEATSIAFRYDVNLPRDLVMVFKSIMTLEGIARQLDPDFDILSAAAKFSPQVLAKQYDPTKVAKDLLFLGKDTSRFLKHAPRQLGETLRQIESGDLKLNHRILGLTAYTKAHSQGASKIAYAILTVGLLLTTALVTNSNILPVWATLTLWIASALAASIGFFRTFRG